MTRTRSTILAATLATLTLIATSGCRIEASTEARARADVVPVSGTFAPRMVAAPPPITSHCSPAPALLASAVCVCGDLGLAGALTTRAPAGLAADVGVNGAVSFASGTEVEGSLRAAGRVASAGSLDVLGHLWGARGVSVTGSLLVTGDLASGKDFGGAGDAEIRGRLRVAGHTSFAGDLTTGGGAPYEAPSSSPCDCQGVYDVAGAVAVARTANDNAAIALADEASLVGARELVLPTGRYYLRSLESAGDLRVVAAGAVQLYVEGDLSVVGASRFALRDGASLDLFVSGSVSSAGSIDLGDASRPDAFRLYVGGEGAEISLAGDQDFHGMIYAPKAKVSLAGDTSVHGAIFAGGLHKAGSLTVRYAAVTSQGERCEDAATREVATPRVE